MVVAYGWRLKPTATLGEEDAGAAAPESRESFPHELSPEIPAYGYAYYQSAAVNMEREARAAAEAQRWGEAWRKYQLFAGLFDRFRSTAILAAAREGYLKSANCAFRGGNPGLCLRALSQYFSTGEFTTEAVNLKRAAKEFDTQVVGRTKQLLESGSMTQEQVEAAVRVAVHYPLRSRLALAEQVLEKYQGQYNDHAQFLLDRANLHMAQGKWREAVALLTPAAPDHPRVAETLAQWQSWMTLGEDGTGAFFGPVPHECPFDVVDAVNRGFTFFANAFYQDALQWFLFGLAKAESDPFAVFGHALCMWEKGMFALAADRLRLAIERIRDRSKPRFLGFFRWDDTCPPRSYSYDPRHLIFNPAECLERVTKRESFVSHILLP